LSKEFLANAPPNRGDGLRHSSELKGAVVDYSIDKTMAEYLKEEGAHLFKEDRDDPNADTFYLL